MSAVKTIVVVVILAALGCLPWLVHHGKDLEDYGPGERRVLMVGVEGLSWLLVQPMIDAGQLPNLGAVQERTTQRVLGSVDRGPDSAGLHPPKPWTTVSTGFSPEEHAVNLMTHRPGGQAAEVPITSLQRARPHIWEVASALGLRVAVAGWWGSWPAEWVDGLNVSDRFYADRFDAGAFGSAGSPTVGVPDPPWPGLGANHLCYPEDRADSLAAELEGSDRHPLLDTIARLQTQEGEEIRGDLAMLASAIRQDLLVTTTLEKELQRGERVHLAAGMLTAIDVVLPLFYKYRDPGPFQALHVPEPIRRGLEPARIQRLRGLIPETLRFVDQQLGRLMRAMGEDASTVLVSTHTWRARTAYVARDYCMNPLLEKLGLLVRTEAGAIDYEKSRVWDYDLQPYWPKRRLSMNFKSLFPHGFIEDDVQAHWPRAVNLLCGTKVDRPWEHPNPQYGKQSHMFFGLGPEVAPGMDFFFTFYHALPVGEALTFPSGERGWVDDYLPPLRHSAEMIDLPTMVVILPEGEESRGVAHETPVGDERVGPQTVAPTILAMLGLPRPVPPTPVDATRPSRPQRIQYWMMPDEWAQQSALELVAEKDYVDAVGREIGSGTDAGARYEELHGDLKAAGLVDD